MYAPKVDQNRFTPIQIIRTTQLCSMLLDIIRTTLSVKTKVLKGASVRRGVFVFVRRGVSPEALRRKLFEHHNI